MTCKIKSAGGKWKMQKVLNMEDCKYQGKEKQFKKLSRRIKNEI